MDYKCKVKLLINNRFFTVLPWEVGYSTLYKNNINTLTSRPKCMIATRIVNREDQGLTFISRLQSSVCISHSFVQGGMFCIPSITEAMHMY